MLLKVNCYTLCYYHSFTQLDTKNTQDLRIHLSPNRSQSQMNISQITFPKAPEDCSPEKDSGEQVILGWW